MFDGPLQHNLPESMLQGFGRLFFAREKMSIPPLPSTFSFPHVEHIFVELPPYLWEKKRTTLRDSTHAQPTFGCAHERPPKSTGRVLHDRKMGPAHASGVRSVALCDLGDAKRTARHAFPKRGLLRTVNPQPICDHDSGARKGKTQPTSAGNKVRCSATYITHCALPPRPLYRVV